MTNKFLNLRIVVAIAATCLTTMMMFSACNKNDEPNPNLGEKEVMYIDAQGNKVIVPYGSMACVLKVVSCTADENTNAILGAPNNSSYITLDKDDAVVLEFGVYITNGDNNDIYVFNVGAANDAIKVEVSDDLTNWTYAGTAGGSSSGVDLAQTSGGNSSPAKSSAEQYRYVRLTNASGTVVKINAVAALHPAATNGGDIDGDIEFQDSRGNTVIIPGGVLSCATFVVDFQHGTPWTSDVGYQNPNNILGVSVGDVSYEVVTLGAYGVIVVGFNVFITDGEGNDIYVFEVGPDVEPTKVEVSNDLTNWVYVGDAAGSISGVDMHGKIPSGAKYKYVRLTDLDGIGSSYAGADVGGVAIIHPDFK
ncbi:MAG: hypothetical protein FWD66_10895 [Paludibacter sp.]|nr:hypothetical protein [Paludibacter sp.]